MPVFHLFWVDFSQVQAYLRRDITLGKKSKQGDA